MINCKSGDVRAVETFDLVSSLLFDLAAVAGKSASASAATVCRGKTPSRPRVAVRPGEDAEATADEACRTDFHARKDERITGEGVESASDEQEHNAFADELRYCRVISAW